MKVKVFTTLYPDFLTDMINEFLKESPNIVVVDIKYSISADDEDIYHAAMIIYKEE